MSRLARGERQVKSSFLVLGRERHGPSLGLFFLRLGIETVMFNYQGRALLAVSVDVRKNCPQTISALLQGPSVGFSERWLCVEMGSQEP